MENQKPQDEQENPSDNPEHFWGFWGYDFIKRSDGKIYEPVTERPRDHGQNNTPSPAATIKIKRDFFEWVMAISGWVVSVLTLGIIGVYTYYAGGQWEEMKKAAKASTDASQTAICALEENKRQFQSTLDQMKDQTKAQFASVNTAKEALHISERAYLTVDIQGIDYAARRAKILITNTGHIPPGRVKTTVHEATVARSPVEEPPYRALPTEEMHWTEDVTDNFSTKDLAVVVRIPMLNKDRIENRKQKVFIVGQTVYNDGFPKTTDKITPFCFTTDVRSVPGTVVWYPCDWKTEVNISKKLDLYPGPQYHTHD